MTYIGSESGVDVSITGVGGFPQLVHADAGRITYARTMGLPLDRNQIISGTIPFLSWNCILSSCI
jgi:hypothetical protein